MAPKRVSRTGDRIGHHRSFAVRMFRRLSSRALIALLVQWLKCAKTKFPNADKRIQVASPGVSCCFDVSHETPGEDRKSTRLNSSHSQISYAVFCLKKKKKPGVRVERGRI